MLDKDGLLLALWRGKTERDNLIVIQQIAHAMLFQGYYDEALAIYRQNWDKPLNGKTFGEITLEDFVAFDKAGLTHPDLFRLIASVSPLLPAEDLAQSRARRMPAAHAVNSSARWCRGRTKINAGQRSSVGRRTPYRPRD